MVFPVRRVWFAVSARVKVRKNGAGLLKLRDDIQTCGYEDVQVMWEMLRRTESELMSRHTKHVADKLGLPGRLQAYGRMGQGFPALVPIILRDSFTSSNRLVGSKGHERETITLLAVP
ncbi:hypothetical protein ACH5RR_024734 [Cinchona calisaya]|uniref:Uncharacterized protein n=1 Tax=Cinchona calisaya TaxID=153742 RepID=A0ABD2Z0S6_9GENT